MQREIVEKNARLIMERSDWHQRIQRFENAMEQLDKDEDTELKRDDYIVRFDGHAFEDGDKDFSSLTFPCRTSFRRVKFGAGDVNFGSCIFSNGMADFFQAEFKGNVRFDASDFYGQDLVFAEVEVIGGSVTLYSCSFNSSQLSMWGSEIKDGVLEIQDVDLKGSIDCSDMKIGALSLSGTRIHGVSVFNNCFLDQVPDFRNTNFERSPEIGMHVPPPTMLVKQLALVAEDQLDVHRYRKLKALAITANDHEKDGQFFAYEMMAKRGVEHTTFWQLLFNTIYWKVSFYGQSYLRPLGWLASSFATFATIYALMAALPIGGWQSLAFGITYSFKNNLPFLGTLTRSVPSPEGHISWFALQLQAIKDAQPGPDWFTVLGTGQAMLSLFFFFFLLLGLRNKFRLK